MFLSVIVSCHNCKPYIQRVLNSLVIQEFKDFEVIISDDNSTDGFMELVKPYEQLLTIKYYKTKQHQYHCPGNTRRDGWEHATGQWITFMDHDDAFLPGAFGLLYKTYQEAETKYHFMYSPVAQVNQDGETIKVLEAATWLHGNFYDRQWLIDNDINFKEDLFGNEDLYFNNLVYGVINGNKESYWSVNKALYQWFVVPESLSNRTPENTDCGYTEKYFNDYLTANTEPHLTLLQKFPDNFAYYQENVFRALIYAYFYYERAIFTYKDQVVLNQMLEACKETFWRYKMEINGNVQELIDYAYKDPQAYIDQRQSIYDLSGKFIENHSFKEFLNIISDGKSNDSTNSIR